MAAQENRSASSEAERIRMFSDYWVARCDGDRIPSFRQILPEEVFKLLPNLVVWRVVDKGADFVCRIVGQDLNDNYGAPQTGLKLSQMIAVNPSVAIFADNFRRCVDSRRPFLAIDHFLGHLGTPKKTVGIVAPLADDGDRVSDVICCSIYFDQADLSELDKSLPAQFGRIANVA